MWNFSDDRVAKIINNWDPINLLSFCPEDEYEQEIELVKGYINKLITTDKLAERIFDIFCSQFGEDVFLKDIEDCKKIARQILELN